MNTKPSKRILASVALSLMVFSGLTSYPHRAYAIFGLGDIVSINLEEALRSNVLNPLAYTVAKIALHSLEKSVVNWINSGFNGSPAFVQDLNKSLLDVGDAQAQRFITQFQGSQTAQSPWGDDVAQGILLNYFRNTSRDSFSLNNPYTLDQVSDDPAAFVAGDYSKGGLSAWMSVVLNCGNNPLCTYQNAGSELANQVSNVQGTKITELNWANGFSSFRNCPAPAKSGPTNLLQGTPYSGTGATTNTSGSSLGSQTASAGATTILDASKSDCLNLPILTPGALIAQAANKHLVDAGVEEYISADSVGEVINLLIGNLVGKVLGGNGLKGVSEASAGGGASYIDQATDPNAPTAGSNGGNLSTAFLQTVSQQITLITQYQSSWSILATTASNAKTALGSTSCPLVDSTLTQAGSATAVANNALSKLAAISAALTQNVSADPTVQQELIATSTTQFASIQADGTLPSTSDIEYALSESVARTANSSTGTTESLYSKLVDISTTKTCIK